MKNKLVRLISILMLLILAIGACAPAQSEGGAESTESLASTDAQSTEVQTEEQTTEAATTEADTSDVVYIDRPEKKVKNLLLIGNSFCYYFTEELYAIAAADGYELNVANLYESGCPVADHWAWLNSGAKNYTFFYVSKKYNGMRREYKVDTVQGALDFAKNELGVDWDVISLQQHFYPSLALKYSSALQSTAPYAKKLYDRIRAEHPDSKLVWHQTWAYEVGYAVPEKYVGEPKNDTAIPDVATQTATYETIAKVSKEVAEQNGVNIIPCGDAWQVARADSRVGDTMCKRLGVNGDLGDYYHDGDVGGGQYLNACVWYEALTGNSCIGNTWRPRNYKLSEEKIIALQEAAHKAVAEMYGPGYAK